MILKIFKIAHSAFLDLFEDGKFSNLNIFVRCIGKYRRQLNYLQPKSTLGVFFMGIDQDEVAIIQQIVP